MEAFTGNTAVSNGSDDLPNEQKTPKDKEAILKYDRDIILGRGSFGAVFSGTLNGEPVAVKRILLDNLNKNYKTREEAAMKRMDHPNVLELKDVREDLDFKFLILELCIGTVRNYINCDDRLIDSKMPSNIEALCQMANGLDYIHSKDIVHRDIKPDNVLISPSYILKISDFGFSKPTAPTGSFSTNSGAKGTRIYYAPEYLQLEDNIKLTSEEKKNIRANKSIDIFSLGCLFFSYLMRNGPYTHLFATPNKQYYSDEDFTSDVTTNIRNGKKFLEENGISNGHYAFQMIDGMTKADSKDRWSLSEKKSDSSETVIDILKQKLECAGENSNR